MAAPVEGVPEHGSESEIDADDDDFESTFWQVAQWALVAAVLVVLGGAFLVISTVLFAL